MNIKKPIEQAKKKIQKKLKNSGRRAPGEDSLSARMGDKNMPPADRGAHEKESTTQGSD